MNRPDSFVSILAVFAAMLIIFFVAVCLTPWVLVLYKKSERAAKRWGREE